MLAPVVRRLWAAVAITLALAGCSWLPPDTSPSHEGSTGTARATPWDDRPVVNLSVVMDEDLGGARGSQTILFTPDREICEVVLRTWANGPLTAREGTSVEVTRAEVDSRPATPKVSAGGAPARAPGTVVEIPLSSCREAGEQVEVAVDFRLTMAETLEERIGVASDLEAAWVAGGFPLLAWVREEGWAREDAVALPGETATSEEFELASMTVTAPEQYTVLGTGAPTGAEPATRRGWTVHGFEAAAVRNLALSVGRFDLRTADAGGVRVRVGIPQDGTRVDGDAWLEAHIDYLGKLESLLGPFPYEDLWVTVTPSRLSGIESPTALFYGDVGWRQMNGLVAHELAHQWTYALVGNNQARDPWVDEAFATFAQAVVTETENRYTLDEVDPSVAGYLGYPMRYWTRQGDFDTYYEGVYEQGAAVLLAGREAVGEERFDAALRAYVQQNAHRVAQPSDVESAFSDLPEVVELLREYGAFDAPPHGSPFG